LPEARQIWVSESVAQLSEVSDQHRPWHFYAPQWLLMALPWTPILIWGVVLRARKRRSLRPWFPLLWFVVTVVFFSFVDMKKNAYLLPAAPALVMLTGQALATTLAWLRRERFAKGAWGLVLPMGLIGAAWAAATFGFALRIYSFIGAGAAVLAIVAAAQPLLVARRVRVNAWQWIWWQAVAYVVVLCVYASVWHAGKENARSPRLAGNTAAAIANATNGKVRLPEGLPHVGVYVPTHLVCPPEETARVIIIENGTPPPEPSMAGERWSEEGVPGPWRVWRLVPRPASNP